MKASVNEGKISIDTLKLNGKKLALNYVLLPSEIVFRFNDGLIGSISSNARIEYIKDAMKIFKTSPVIGRGGEAFRYLYKEVQTGTYNSTEVHSSFIQILIESGALGFICISMFVIYTIFKTENNENKIIFILFVIHSIFELNFSYTISVIFLGIIAGCLDYTKSTTKGK